METKENIVYFDNEPENLIGFKSIFNRFFNVFIATTKEEVIPYFDNYFISVAILDFHTPSSNLTNLIDECKKRNAHTSFLIITALVSSDSAIDIINQHNIYGYIKKPWDSNVVKLILKNASEACHTKKDKQNLINTLVTKNQELEQAISRERQANALKNSFLKNLSHEIRTPLNAILGFNQLIAMNSHEPKLEQYSKCAISAGSELLTTIENMLEASKIANNQVLYRNAIYKADELLMNCINHWKNLTSKDQTIRTHISSDASIFIDNQKTERAIFALLTNAHQIAPEKPIDVFLKTIDDNVLIEIADQGPGIPDSHQDTIFEPFGKSKTKGAVNKSGIGISLYIAKSHINNMNGHIDVLSEPGQGARFFITFPIVVSDKLVSYQCSNDG